MELRQLSYFVAVAEERHFTRASQRVMVAQPAISQQIRRLEAELGETLFHRDRHTVSLTAAGHALLPHARAALAAVARAGDAVASLRDLVTGRLAVGVFQGAPEGLAAGLLGAYHRQHPGVELWVKEEYAATLLSEVRSGQLDVALTGLPPRQPTPAGVGILEIATESLVVLIAPEDPLAKAKRITLTSLRDRPLISVSRQSTMRSEIDAACANAGFQPHIVAEANHLRLLVELVAQGLGVAIGPPSIVPRDAHVTAVPLTQPAISVRTVVAHGERAVSPATRAFLALARAQLTANGTSEPG